MEQDSLTTPMVYSMSALIHHGTMMAMEPILYPQLVAISSLELMFLAMATELLKVARLEPVLHPTRSVGQQKVEGVLTQMS